MTANEIIHQRIRAELTQAQNIVITGHIRPDGDAIGSMLGLAQALREQGKQVQTVLQDPIDPKYSTLIGADGIKDSIEQAYDYLIVVDSADRARVGNVLDDATIVDLAIDHHISHEDFAEIDFVVANYEATALLIYDCLSAWGLAISKESAECLMTGILSDTIGFRTSSTTPKSLHAVAEMMALGVSLPDVYFKTLSSRSIEELRYWGLGLGKLHYEDGIVWTSLDQQDRETSGFPRYDDADLINHLSSMQGALIAIIFVEQPGGSVKISWRSVPGVDVSRLASKFGGGGHAAAAGADVPGDLATVMEQVLTKSKSYLANRL